MIMAEGQESLLFEVEETLSPVERFIILHGMEITPPHTIKNKGVEIHIDWIAGIGNLYCIGKSRNEAAYELAKALRLTGWTAINWGL